MDQEHKKINKTADRKAYMREYMKQYNAKKPKAPRPQRITQTAEQKKAQHKTSLRKYYLKNKDNILKHKKVYNTQKRIQKLEDKLEALKSNI